jgi:hypothetical protein
MGRDLKANAVRMEAGNAALRRAGQNPISTSATSVIGPSVIHLDEKVVFPVTICSGIPPFVQPSLPPRASCQFHQRWSAGKTIDWLMTHFGIEPTAETRCRFISPTTLQVVDNGVVLQDHFKAYPEDKKSGFVIIPESMLTPVVAACTALPSPCGVEHLQKVINQVKLSRSTHIAVK